MPFLVVCLREIMLLLLLIFVHDIRFSWPILDANSNDDYDTLYCTFVKKRYLERTMGTMSVLDPYKPTRQDMYAITMMNMEDK